MFPRELRAYSLDGHRLEPRYLTADDYPWLRELLDAHSRCVGRRRRDFQDQVARGLDVPAPTAKLRMAAHFLDRKTTDRVCSPLPPARIRTALFRNASTRQRVEALCLTARELALAPEVIEAFLFADLPGERLIKPLMEPLSPALLAVQVNTALAASFLQRSSHVRLTAHGNLRALVRHAKLVGLLCVIELQGDTLTMEISGPYSLFRQTLVYGRALASLLPRLAWCRDFRLVAECAIDTDATATLTARQPGHLEFVVTKGDPLESGRELPPFDSAVEERFARDMGRLSTDWVLVREPCALPTRHGLFFPDFELVHRRDERRRWLVEIVGFWTEAYLRGKREALSAVGIDRVIVCVDETKSCGLEGLPKNLAVVPFRRRVKVRAVLDIIEAAV